MKIEKLDNFDTDYIYSMNGPIGRLVDRMHQLIDAFNSLDRPSIKVRTGMVEMCKECQVIPAVLCEKCTKEEKETELLPCPFCGVPPDISDTLSNYHIKCGNSLCDFVVENAYKLKSKKEAIETWSKRKC